MVDVNQPVTNPGMVDAIARMREQNSPESQNHLLNELMRARFLSPADLSPQSEMPNEDGKIVLRESSTFSFSMLNNAAGEHFFMAFTDWDELHKWKNVQGQQTLMVTFDDLAMLLLAEGSQAAGFVVNPYGGNVSFDREMVAALKAEKDRIEQRAGVVEQVVERDTAVQLGEPENWPEELGDALTACFKREKQVKAVWLRLMHKGGEASWLLVVELTGEEKTVFEKISQAVSGLLDGMPLDMVSYDSTFGKNATDGVQPFYKRKRFGLFG